MLLTIWGERGAGRGGLPLSDEEQLDALNERRRHKGLPPLSAEEAAENVRQFRERLKRG